ncbi:hypothetical protein [Streptomyces tropicalis]|uniref:Uncharacterized protein n=1 Tax=Streptomyces tropicalis TaxID=3034234 RepID=A0ABT6A9X6_9ACTN|nr:hypothetical protein [Streptomyces tropicalis]MDF3301454.1 hypothetical protein [Streptomyces tropicalis]
MSSDTGHTGIVHWRRSVWNGARCEPVLVTLRPDGLRLQDRSLQTVLQADPRAVTGRLTRLGTLVLTVDGRRYALVGRGASLSPAPSAGQQRAVDGTRRETSEPAAAGGVVDALLNGGAAARMRAWHARLAAAGARLS